MTNRTAPGATVPEVGYRLDVPSRPTGPAVRALLRRSAIGIGALAAVATVSALRSKQPGTKALALGALMPGGGYLYTRSPFRFLTTVTGFLSGLAVWFGTGNILMAPFIWLTAAVDARKQAKAAGKVWKSAPSALPVVLAGTTAVAVVANRRAFHAAQDRGRVRAQYLAKATRLDPRPSDVDRRELSDEDLAVLRSVLDRALQPIDQFDGFSKVDQFQTAATRYQLSFLQWALTMAQLHHTPSFHGYLSAGQRNLIDKMTLPEVWRYWAIEQTWGNLSLDWDPMKRDNIMLSGYLGVMLGAYESNTGDDRYRLNGALPFRLGKRTWPYTHDMVAAAVHANMNRSDMTLFPCEPNWIYSGCNMTGINTLLLSDRVHGTRFIESIGELFQRRLHEEFITADGRMTAIRSARFGVTIPMLTSSMADAGTAAMLHSFDPDLAQRSWTIVREEFVNTDGPEPTVALRGWDAMDTGNYRKTPLGPFGMVMWAAAEMGDTELHNLMAASLDRQSPPVEKDGTLWYEGFSTMFNATLALARFNPPGGYRAMISEGPGTAVLTGPVLEGVSYPDVLVASTATDGSDLHLVLRPGDGPTRTALGIERLVPGRSYDVRGALIDTLTADAEGRASVSIDLPDRTEVSLTPSL